MRNLLLFALVLLLPQAGHAGSTVKQCSSALAAACPFDLTCDGQVNANDVEALNAVWGKRGAADFNNDNKVDGSDLGMLLGAWGACQRTAPPKVEVKPNKLYAQCIRRLRLSLKNRAKTSATLKASACRAYLRSRG